MFGAMHGGGGTLSLKAESLDPRTWMQQQQAIPQMQDQPGLVDFFNLKGLSSISSAHIDSPCLETISSILKTRSTLKCRNALGLDFTALTQLCFSVALCMYILAL